MDVFEAIRARRNVRQFDGRPVPPTDLDRILEAGRLAPSAGNSQPWDFILVTDRALLEALAGVWQGARHVAASAATIALVAPVLADPGRSAMVEFDLGQVTAHLMLAAAELGVGSAHAAVRDQDLARQILGLPGDRRLAWLIALGYPATRALRPRRHPNRRPLEEIVHLDRWNEVSPPGPPPTGA
ncbi:MAG TPA: nitroreductase family protein [Actinomycetota bacterium]|nr:nitroreductase family protein [Actinomycetota bacterium]